MFKIPENFKLGGINYWVKMFVERGGGMGLGQHDGKNSVIEIAQDIPPDRQAKTFVHESLHGIIEQYGVDIPDEQEEKIVSQLCTGITEMIDQIVEYAVSETLKECREYESEKYVEENQVLAKVISDSHRLLSPLVVNKDFKAEEFNSTPTIATGTLFKSHIRMTEYTNWLIKKLLDNTKEKS